MGTLLDYLIDHLPQFRRARLASLYSDFRQQRYSNPDGYAANLGAWETALAYAAETQALPETSNSLSITVGPYLLDALESREWGTPSALGTVLSEAISQGRFIPRATFVLARPGLVEHDSSSVSWKAMSWALAQLGMVSWMPDKMPSGVLVVLANLKKASERLNPFISERQSRVDQIWAITDFKAKVTELLNLKGTISDQDLEILLIYLSRDRKLLAYGDDFVKFRGSISESLDITQQDRNIASLKLLISDLSIQTQQVSTRIEELQQRVHSALMNKNKAVALRHLRSKKVQESLLSQRSDALLQLEDVLNQIEQAANQIEVISVLKSSTSVLKGLNTELGNVDSIQDVLDSINEEMIKTWEISNTIGDTSKASLLINEGDLDDELAALESQSRDEKNKVEIEKIREVLDQVPIIGKDIATESDQGASTKLISELAP